MPPKVPFLLQRGSSLGLLLLGCVAVVKVATQPLNPTLKQTILPETLQLENWQLTQATPETSANTGVSYDQLRQGRAYDFTQQGKQVKLQLGYFFNTNGDVLVLQNQIQSLQSESDAPKAEWTKHSQPSIGRYLMGQPSSDETVLLTCVNDSGENTVDREQFSENRLKYDVTITQLLKWLAGRSQFLDQRCLWTRLSVKGFDSNQQALQEAETLLRELQPQLGPIL